MASGGQRRPLGPDGQRSGRPQRHDSARLVPFRERHDDCTAALAMSQQGASVHVISGTPTGIATTRASVLVGLEAYPIRVEVTCTRGPSGFQMVGLAEAAVRESKVR